MFERFTDRARKAMALANQEAQRFNHQFLGSEHLLLGLVKEGSGVAANVLKNLDVDLRKVRLEVEKLVKSGPDMVTMGKLPQTPEMKRAIEKAIEEARGLDHNYVGTEHLLLGLLQDPDTMAGKVLSGLGLAPDGVRVRSEIMAVLKGKESPVPAEMPAEEAKVTTSIFGCPVTLKASVARNIATRLLIEAAAAEGQSLATPSVWQVQVKLPDGV